MLISLGIFVAIMGGYLLNAETVPSCVTEWDYVTDISGAFQGDKSDMDVEYNPISNVTGYSYLDEYNEGWISGVRYATSDYTNAYPVYVDRQVANLAATVTSTGYDGRSTPGFSIASSLTITGDQPDGFGLRNGEAVTMFYHGEYVVQGAFAVPLSKVLEACHGTDYAEIVLTLTSASGYPCFAEVSKSTAIGTWRHLPGSATLTSAITTVTALNSADTAKAFPQSGTVTIGSRNVPVADVLLVFGQAQYNGAGDYTDSVSIAMVASVSTDPEYMDPAAGVTPYQGTYTTTDAQVVDHPGSSSPTITMAFSSNDASVWIRGAVTFRSTSDTVQRTAFSYDYIAEGVLGGITIRIGEDEHTYNMGSSSFTLTVSPQGSGTFALTVGSTSAGTVTMAPVIASMWVNVSQATAGAYLVSTVTRDDGSSVVNYDSGPLFADLSYRTTEGVSVDHAINGAYWRNDYDNTEVSIAFIGEDGVHQSNSVTTYGPAGEAIYFLSRSASGTWSVTAPGGGNSFVQIGKWPGIMVTFRADSASVYPISSFKDFTDFETVDAPVVLENTRSANVDDTQPKLITSFYVAANTDGKNLRMSVARTLTHISQGGLYLQDGAFNLRSSFPTSDAVSLTIGSTAHLGDSITFSSGSSSVTLPVNADRTVTIGARSYPLNGITFRWYSASGPSAEVAGSTYGPAIYHNGQTYAAGRIWAEVKGGDMVEVVQVSGDDWSMVLDGVWAPAVNMYDGHNEASSKTELMDFTHGIFRWDKADFLIVLMGVVVAGGILGAYLKLCTTADWVVIGVAVAGIWLIL